MNIFQTVTILIFPELKFYMWIHCHTVVFDHFSIISIILITDMPNARSFFNQGMQFPSTCPHGPSPEWE